MALVDALLARPADEVVLLDSNQSLTSTEVLTEFQNLAKHLQSCRVLAVLADNSADWVMADLAALHCGIVHLPIPTFFSPAQVVHIFELTGADALLTDQSARIEALQLGFVVVFAWRSLIFMRRKCVPVDLPTGTAKISFTSGSTGTPKGVCLSGSGLIATAAAIHSQLAALHINRHLAVLPLSLLLENTAGIYAALLSGASIQVPSLPTLGWRGMAAFAPDLLQQAVIDSAAQSLILVPELLKAWTLYLSARGHRAPDGLAFVAVGGARVDSSLLGRARALGIPAYEGYGLTECGSVVSLNLPGDDGSGVGRPLPHVRLRLEGGQFHVTTAAFLGYVTAKSDSAKSLPMLRATEFATGDLGHLDSSGHLHLSGRRSNLLITAFGRNISPEWVESVLLAQSAITQAVVVGDAQPCLCAVLVPLPGTTADQVSAAVVLANAALPDYARLGFWLISEPFTLQNKLATGNGRPIRNVIAQHHASAIAALYSTKESP